MSASGGRILILRDAFRGLRRFDEFRDSLGIAPTMLTKRLNALVESGLLAAGGTASIRPGTSTS
jgi:DNA-binding HxlR family transcriptional regulator